MIGIYMIRNKINNKRYIGQSRNIRRRWAGHRWSAGKFKYELSKDLKKYGIDNFEFSVLEECSINELNEKEKEYIRLKKPEYNISSGGPGNTGYCPSEETRKKLSKKNKEYWKKLPKAKKLKIIQTQLTGPTIGKPRTKETKAKLRTKALIQFKNGMPDDTKKKIAESNKKAMRGNCNRKRKVAKLDENGNVIKVFKTIKEAAESVHVHPTSVLGVCKGKRKTSAGYKWKYCD